MSDQLTNDLQSLRINRVDKPPSGGGGSSRVLSILGIVALLGVGAFATQRYVLPYASANLSKQEVSITEVSTIFPQQGQIDLTATGWVVPQNVAKVGAKVIGRVQKSSVKEWEEVKQDQVLFVLDPTDQRAAISSAQSRVMAARARAQAARARVSEVKIQYEREKQLAASGAVSRAGAEDLGARLSSMSEQARASDAEASALQAEVGSLEANMLNLVVKSPMNGVASTKPVQVGDVVRPDQVLVEISDMSSLVVEADVAEARLALVKVGAPCEVVLDAYPGRRFRGAVIEVSPILDRAKASAKVKVKFVDKADVARGQMSVRVSFLAQEQTAEAMKEAPKKVIPVSAVVDRNGQKSAFVVQGGVARLRSLNLGPKIAAGYELLDDLPAGTKIVNNPPPTLMDGQAVKEPSS